ncbi:MAG: hypothetical protein IJH12_02150 [Clostridia bacterium]|nr:hypothetical protein [Clostridia bacterium]
MKNTKKLILLLVLSIFLVGMLMGSATATHTVKVGKYTGTISDNDYKKLQNAKSKNKDCSVLNVKSNNKGYSMAIYYNTFSGYEPMSGITFEKGFLGSVWKNGEESPIIAYKKATISSKTTTNTKKNTVYTKPHTYNLGGYKVTVSAKQYTQLKKHKNTNTLYIAYKNIGNKNVKVPKYKTVKKKVWETKLVLDEKLVYSSDWSDSTWYEYHADRYSKAGWKYYGSKTVESNNGHVIKYYQKYKKQVTKNVKVKNGYKTVKVPIKAEIWSNGMYKLYDKNGYFYKSGKVNI